MRILLCNDDGWDALGIQTLRSVLIEAGHDVTVCAPAWERSGQSHALTFSRPIIVEQVTEKVFSIDGTPADCAVLGINQLMESKPDVVVSGINHGLNVGWDVNYSGTVGAATEANYFGLKSIAVSADIDNSKYSAHELFRMSAKLVANVLEHLHTLDWPHHEILNINHPNCKPKGVVLARCEGAPLWVPSSERIHSNLYNQKRQLYVLGSRQRTLLQNVQPEQDVSLIQSGYATMSFIRSRQSTSSNNQKLQAVAEKITSFHD